MACFRSHVIRRHSKSFPLAVPPPSEGSHELLLSEQRKDAARERGRTCGSHAGHSGAGPSSCCVSHLSPSLPLRATVWVVEALASQGPISDGTENRGPLGLASPLLLPAPLFRSGSTSWDRAWAGRRDCRVQ